MIMFIILDSHYHPSWSKVILHDHHPILQDDQEERDFAPEGQRFFKILGRRVEISGMTLVSLSMWSGSDGRNILCRRINFENLVLVFAKEVWKSKRNIMMITIKVSVWGVVWLWAASLAEEWHRLHCTTNRYLDGEDALHYYWFRGWGL